MTLVTDDIDTAMRCDLALARLELQRARETQRTKDTPAARNRVAACATRLDELLDMWNAARVART